MTVRMNEIVFRCMSIEDQDDEICGLGSCVGMEKAPGGKAGRTDNSVFC
jgi:hypothetical protein